MRKKKKTSLEQEIIELIKDDPEALYEFLKIYREIKLQSDIENTVKLIEAIEKLESLNDKKKLAH